MKPIKVDHETHRAAKIAAAENGTSITNLVTMFIRDGLGRMESGKVTFQELADMPAPGSEDDSITFAGR